MIVALWLGVSMAIATSVVGIVFYFYNQQTAPNREDPGAAVQGYLFALFVDRDDVKAAEFTCQDPVGLKPLVALRDDIKAREDRFRISISVDRAVLGETKVNDSVVVPVELRVNTPEINGNTSIDIENWDISVVGTQSRWRVCGATKRSG